MSTEELKEYLGIVVDMEKSIFLQERLLKEMTEKVGRLGVPKTYEKPIQPTQLSEPEKKITLGEMLFWIFLSPIVLCVGLWEIFCEYIGPAIGLIAIAVGVELLLFYINFALGIVGVCALVFGFLWLIMGEIQANNLAKEQKHLKEEQEKLEKERVRIKFESEMASYHNNIKFDALRVAHENAEKDVLASEIEEIKRSLSTSKKILIYIYAKNVIFPKYRNLVAVCSLYEYICAGRCYTLEGHEGAYNLYETEMRLDRIITQLDKVIANLGAIRENQFMLFSAIQDMNRQSVSIMESTQEMAEQLWSINGQAGNMAVQIADLQKTSALTAYHDERTRKELAYMNRMDYLSGRNDDVFFNHPPV